MSDGFPSTGMPSRFAKYSETRLDFMHERQLTSELKLAIPMGERTAGKLEQSCWGGGGGHELMVTGIDALDSRPGGENHPALLGGVVMGKGPKHGSRFTYLCFKRWWRMCDAHFDWLIAS